MGLYGCIFIFRTIVQVSVSRLPWCNHDWNCVLCIMICFCFTSTHCPTSPLLWYQVSCQQCEMKYGNLLTSQHVPFRIQTDNPWIWSLTEWRCTNWATWFHVMFNVHIHVLILKFFYGLDVRVTFHTGLLLMGPAVILLWGTHLTFIFQNQWL